ncbi:isoprenylcysteine carboxyl methyltransferase family protein [Pseudalkalibacillus caeni]|uniref:Isoprenylcysteine carboxyl methyltransferase n=1 Tax=Exobacillus caeni TaxID=2574798 RepID=A0A5R9EZK1_9BACL|nr:isoprenylcysteine carboxylmethyltransferase family protein [Pseudalkalibacillus caeni]TLS35636.1 hypothetical protein FCL54_19235 [Pseudalkalibacillus caeni]
MFWIILAVVIVQRLGELAIAKKNERWMKKQGAYEVGADHYPQIVLLHIVFFLSLIIEAGFHGFLLEEGWIFPLGIFILAQFVRVWSLRSLGDYWNTKIIVLPGSDVVIKGPYRFIRHPNYLVVAVEILTLPLMFQAFFTAVFFTMLNAWILLKIRIPAEEKALAEMTSNYKKTFLKE